MERTYARRVGVVFALIGAVSLTYLSYFVLFLFGLLPHGHAVVDEFARAAIVVLGLLVYATSRLPEAERSAVGPRA